MSELDLEALAEIVGEFVDLSGIRIDENAVLGEDIPIDSREMLRLVTRLEARYKARFSPKDLLTTRTLGDLLAVTRRRSRMT